MGGESPSWASVLRAAARRGYLLRAEAGAKQRRRETSLRLIRHGARIHQNTWIPLQAPCHLQPGSFRFRHWRTGTPPEDDGPGALLKSVVLEVRVTVSVRACTSSPV